jgi:16S rRNA (guanine966-N2)-methyltransferase
MLIYNHINASNQCWDQLETSNALRIISGTLKGKKLHPFHGKGIRPTSDRTRGAIFNILSAAVLLLEKNLRSCCLEERARVIPWDIERNLNCLQAHGLQYHLIFLDPPYHSGMALTALTHLKKSQAMTPGACLVLEHGEADELPMPLADFELLDQRKYGKTLVSFLTYMV